MKMEIGEDSRKIINRMNNVEPVGRDGVGVGAGREEEGVEKLGEECEGEGAKRLGRRRGRVG